MMLFLIFVPMSYELYVTILAVFYIGATVVFLDAWSNKNGKDSCDLIKDQKVCWKQQNLLAIKSHESFKRFFIKTKHPCIP